MGSLRLRTWDGPAVGAGAPVVLPFLFRHEAIHGIMVATLAALADGREPGDLGLAAVEGLSGVTLAVGLRNPVKYLLSTSEDPAATALLAADAAARHAGIPGWMGPKASADAFAAAWREAGGRAPEQVVRMRVHQLDSVRPGRRAAGHLLPARPEHRSLLLGWTDGYLRDTGVPRRRDIGALVDDDLAAGRTCLWRTPSGAIVSMAGYGGETPNGVRVFGVYTPPEHRRQGYAEACVAALSAHLLAQGHRFCSLYTDLANPTSNALYRRIGYEPVGDVDDHRL